MSASVKNWTCADVSAWLRQIGLGKFVKLFAKHEINGEILLTMKEIDLSSPPLNIDTFGAIRKFGIEIENLKKHPSSLPPPPDQIASMKKTETVKEISIENASASLSGVFLTSATSNTAPIVAEQPEIPKVAVQPEIFENAADSNDVLVKHTLFMNGTDVDHASEMENLFNDFTWRYESNAEMIRQLNPAGVQVEIVVDVSPAEFYVQTASAVSKAQILLSAMNDFYSEKMEPVPFDRVYENMPCAVMFQEEPGWFRAVVREKGFDDVRVVFVDWGNSQFAKCSDLKPLTKDFGQSPPLAIRCRIEGIRERTLTRKVVKSFKDEMESLQMLVKIVPVSFNDDGINVLLFNPNTNENIGEKYLPKSPCVPTDIEDKFEKIVNLNFNETTVQEQKSKSVQVAEFNRHSSEIVEQMKIKAENLNKGLYTGDIEAFFDDAPGFDEADSDDEDYTPKNIKTKQKSKAGSVKPVQVSDEVWVLPKTPLVRLKTSSTPRENEITPFTRYLSKGFEYIRDYTKQAPPPKGDVTVFAAHVVSAKEIYLRTEMQKVCLISVQNALRTIHDDVDSIPLPENLFKSGTACAYKDDDGRWYRAKITNVDETNEETTLVLIDYARILSADRSNRARIKALRVHTLLLEEPLIYKCKLFKLADRPTTNVETELLKEILIENEKFTTRFEVDREPYQVNLKYASTMKEFNEIFEREMSDRNLERIAAQQRNSRFGSLNDCEQFSNVDINPKNVVDGLNSFRIRTKTSTTVSNVQPVPVFTNIVKISYPPPSTSQTTENRLARSQSGPQRTTIDDDADLDDEPDVEIIDEDDSDEN